MTDQSGSARPSLMTSQERVERVLYGLLARAGVDPRPNEITAAAREIVTVCNVASDEGQQ